MRLTSASGSVVDVTDRAARLLGVADVSDRAARILGRLTPGNSYDDFLFSTGNEIVGINDVAAPGPVAGGLYEVEYYVGTAANNPNITFEVLNAVPAVINSFVVTKQNTGAWSWGSFKLNLPAGFQVRIRINTAAIVASAFISMRRLRTV